MLGIKLSTNWRNKRKKGAEVEKPVPQTGRVGKLRSIRPIEREDMSES